jgi:hypothetical protein
MRELRLLDAQAVPPGLELIGEEHRTFHMMNIAQNEYSGQGEEGSFARACNLHARRA